MSESNKHHEYDCIVEHDNPLPTWWLWTFFITSSIASLLTGGAYHLCYKTGRSLSRTLVLVHFGLVFVGLPLTLNLYRILFTLVNAGAPDTTTFAGGLVNFLGPLLLLGALVIFIVTLSTSKKLHV